MQNLEWYLADLKSTRKNTIETVEKSLTDMFIRLVRIYPCLEMTLQMYITNKIYTSQLLFLNRLLQFNLQKKTFQMFLILCYSDSSNL